MKYVKDVLKVKGDTVHSIASGSTVLDALKQMAEAGIGSLAVVDDGELVGIVSERDYARKVVLMDRHSKDTLVGDIMTPNVICVSSETQLDACMSLMTGKHIRHLVVRDDEQLTGLISIGDVVKAIIENQEFTIDQLAHYITGIR